MATRASLRRFLLTTASILPLLFLSGTSTAHPHAERDTAAGDKGAAYKQAFDYVIIGSGPGGAVMARRLSEDQDVSVAVIEAGTWTTDVVGNLSTVPGYNLVFDSQDGSKPTGIDWGFSTTPQTGVGNAKFIYHRGKCIGGSSNLNAMAWAFASSGSFDVWANQVGDSSWNFDTALKYYRKAMNFAPGTAGRRANATPQYRQQDVSTGGPLDVRFPSYAYSWGTWAAYALNAAGVKNTDAFLNGNLNGSSWQTNAINHTSGERASASTYLAPTLSRNNLHLFDKTFAEKIIFDNNKTATGVLVTARNGKQYTLNARKEVILSAGVFQSPQLLQVSGVGPKAVLDQYKIPVVADRPGVGQNLQDQFFFGIAYRVNLPTVVTLGGSPEAVAYADQFRKNGTGPLNNPGGEYAGYEKLPARLRGGFSKATSDSLAKYPADWPELEFETLPAFIGNGRATTAPPTNNSYATILATIQTPSSKGNVTISSSSMKDAPIINPNWLTTQQDIEVSVAMFKRIREVWTAPGMSNITIGKEYFPGEAVQTDKQIADFVRGNTMPIYHASSTNKMGKASDPMAVVDPKGRVYGVKKLRVVDISAFPFILPGTAPQAGVYMLAEKLADVVKQDNK